METGIQWLVDRRVGSVLDGAAVVVRDVGAGAAHDPLLGQSLAGRKIQGMDL